MPIITTIAAAEPPRNFGDLTQDSVEYPVKSASITHAWGTQPSEAVVTYVGAAPITKGAALTLTLDGHVFHGICDTDNEVVADTAQGNIRALLFHDTRLYLQWDRVFGYFNREDVRLVSGVVVRRYRHLLPANYTRGRWTFTTAPYSAAQILDFIFTAPTVGSPWVRSYHADQGSYPVFDVDCTGAGRELGEVVGAITSEQGLSLTLQGGQYNLVWARKGDGVLPSFPATSDKRTLGSALSGNPSRVFIGGARNTYQILGVTLQADWAAGWQSFFDSTQVYDYLWAHGVDPATGIRFDSVSSDPEHIIGKKLAAARVMTITVGELADLADTVSPGSGAALRDQRRFGGRSRLEMPVVSYIREVLFRAYRVPSGFAFTNALGDSLGLDSLTLVPKALVKTTFNPSTGGMTAVPGAAVFGNGLAIVQGARIGSDDFKDTDPERFDVARWLTDQDVWTRMEFSIDDSGEGDQFIQLESMVYRSTDQVSLVDGLAVVGAYPTLTAATVKASLVFEAEPFLYWQGVGSKDGSAYVGGLSAEFYMTTPAASPVEIAYADGEVANDKAARIATTILSQPAVFYSGHWKNVGSATTALTPMLDRITVEYSSNNGLTELVDLTKEARAYYGEPVRRFERRREMDRLFPGQQALRDAADKERLLAAQIRKNLWIGRMMSDAYAEIMGYTKNQTRTTIESPGSVLLSSGTPLWKAPTVSGATATATRAVLPTAVSTTHTVFVGATVFHGQAAAAAEIVAVNGGSAPVRVMGPVSAGDSVGKSDGHDYLVAGGSPTVGRAQQDIGTAAVKLIKVQLNAAVDGGTAHFPFELFVVPESVYVSPAADADEQWERDRTVWVRSGWVERVAPVDLTGSDKVAEPYGSTLNTLLGAPPIVVPEDVERYLFWVHLDPDGSHEIRHGAVVPGTDPETDPDTVAGWDEFPDNAGRIFIGWMDTQTDLATKVAHFNPEVFLNRHMKGSLGILCLPSGGAGVALTSV